MGNTCVGPYLDRHSFLQSISAGVLWRPRESPSDPSHPTNPKAAGDPQTPPTPVSISSDDVKYPPPPPPSTVHDSVPSSPAGGPRPRPRPRVDRFPSAGLRVCSVLPRKTENIKDHYTFGRKLGQGQFGTTYLCVEKVTGKEFACKSIAKRKLASDEDVEDVRREIQIMHHLCGHPNVISIVSTYEDAVHVHLIMDLCAGGELFDRIVQRGHYSEKAAAELARVIIGVVEVCHSMGVMHRDLKPENFLFVNKDENSPLKTIDFGLSVFFKPGDIFTDVVGSPYYVAPEVLMKHYGLEVDVWSAGVIIYILLSGVPPFWHETEQGIFEQVLRGELDLTTPPWPSISDSAKDLVRRMLVRDPKRRLTAHEALCHPWVCVDGIAPSKPLDSAVLTRLKQFSAMNKLKKMAIRADIDNNGTIDYGEFIAATLHLNKIEREDNLFSAFTYFDKDGSGYITHDELQKACEEFGIQDAHIEEIIQEIDQDNDGRIDYNEFVTMMQKGNSVFGKKGPRQNYSFGLREALRLR